MCVCVCMSSMCMGTHGCQKKEFVPLALELQTIVSYQTRMLATKLRSSKRTTSTPNH